MKTWPVILLIVTLSVISCAPNQKKNSGKDNMLSLEPPSGLGDQWSKWLIGEWQGTAKSDFGERKDWVKGNCRLNIEPGLKGQFLVREGYAQVTDLSDDYVKFLKGQKLSDSDVDKIRNSKFESMEIYTIDPNTGDVIGYLFDSLRCVARGTGRRDGNKEIINWTWSVQGRGTSTRVTERISDSKFISTEKYALPDGSTMEDRVEMTRKEN